MLHFQSDANKSLLHYINFYLTSLFCFANFKVRNLSNRKIAVRSGWQTMPWNYFIVSRRLRDFYHCKKRNLLNAEMINCLGKFLLRDSTQWQKWIRELDSFRESFSWRASQWGGSNDWIVILVTDGSALIFVVFFISSGAKLSLSRRFLIKHTLRSSTIHLEVKKVRVQNPNVSIEDVFKCFQSLMKIYDHLPLWLSPVFWSFFSEDMLKLTVKE